MTDEWWDKIYETAALDINDSYVQRLIDEFRFLSEKKNKTDSSSDVIAFRNETS